MSAADRSTMPIIFGTSIEVIASEVAIGDKVAIRNSCGGLVRWERVTKALDYRVLTTEQGLYIVDRSGELVEVSA